MARVTVLLLALLAIPWLAGCAGEKTNDCPEPCTRPGGSEPRLTSTGSTTPTIPPGAVLNQTLEFRNCEGVGGHNTLPIENVRPLVPEDFQLVGYTPLTVNAHVNAVLCERVVDQARVHSQVYYLVSYVHVSPRNQSRDGAGTDWYLLDQRISQPEVAAHLSSLGMPIEEASFTVSNTSADPSLVLRSWRIQSHASAFEIEGVVGSEFDSYDVLQSYWAGSEELRRIDLEPSYQYLHPKFQADALRSEGSSSTQKAFGETSPMVTFTLANFNMIWTIDTQNVFKPEKA